MQITTYLVIEKRLRQSWGRGIARISKHTPKPPVLKQGQVAVKLHLNLPDDLFEPVKAVVNVDAQCLQHPTIEAVAVKENV